MGRGKINNSSNIAVLEELHAAIDERLIKGYEMFDKYLNISVPEELKYFAVDAISRSYDKKHLLNLASASQCFFWFRYLHSDVFHNMHSEKHKADEFIERATLLGDYFFSQFSLYLIPIDSTPLIDEFSIFLNEESSKLMEVSKDKFTAFFERVSEVLDD